jgi:hypothetical protein
MQRWGCLFVAVCLLAFGGCTGQTDQQGGIAVMFDQMPNIIDQSHVYDNGMRVGSIHSVRVGGAGVVQIMVSLEDAFIRDAGDNIALYPHRGRLEVAKLSGIGQPLQKGDLVSGFSSRAGLNWFKLKTMISDRTAASKYRALNLRTLFGTT